jgi:RNA polymerase sigma factor (TIGR02999 family)
MKDVTRLLLAIESGDARAADELLPAVYDELRFLAAQRLKREPAGQTLQATALVHEAYLRLIGPDSESQRGRGWDGRGHFFAAAARATRNILVESEQTRIRPLDGLHPAACDVTTTSLSSIGNPKEQ